MAFSRGFNRQEVKRQDTQTHPQQEAKSRKPKARMGFLYSKGLGGLPQGFVGGFVKKQ
jgi:hypothetical protein